jgi:dGTPase
MTSLNYAPPRAPFACDPQRSRGRLLSEADSRTRTPFQRDRDRIIHATAFRRLKHKTQVFVAPEGDHYRTRLTHSLEVAQIARSMARVLWLDEDLTEALALAHDLGHTAFGHAGEDVLNARMQSWGGFDHNAQSIRIVTLLEQRYAAFDGLNLTWEMLEGLAKHNGPVADPPFALATYCAGHDLELGSWPSLEAQVAAIADDIAYNSHDIDDGIRAGLISVEDLADVALVAESLAVVQACHPGLAGPRLVHELVRKLISRMVDDVLAQTQTLLSQLAPPEVDAVRGAGQPIVGFSPGMMRQVQALKQFLHQHMYRHNRVRALTDAARQVLAGVFDYLHATPAALPGGTLQDDPAVQARAVADYVAGMTDQFILREHLRIFGSLPPVLSFRTA